MTFATVRSVSIAAAVALTAFSAQALTIPTAALNANSFQAFSADAIDSFDLFGVSVRPLGNAMTVADQPATFNLPVTSISIDVLGGLKIQSGAAVGSALEISRTTKDGRKVGQTLANFVIDFTTHVVKADTTPIGGATVKQAGVYKFDELQTLTLKYKFPLSIQAKQILGNLYLTDEARAVMIQTLELPAALANIVLPELNFGTITQDIGVSFRPKAVSTKPYTPVQ